MNPFRLVSRIVPASARVAVSGAAPQSGFARVESDPWGGESVGRGLGAYAVPWRVVHRGDSGVMEIEHAGDGPVRAVRVSLAGRGMLGLTLPRTVHPGERMRLVLRGVAVEGAIADPEAMLIVRWFERDGTELLWPIAL